MKTVEIDCIWNGDWGMVDGWRIGVVLQYTYLTVLAAERGWLAG